MLRITPEGAWGGGVVDLRTDADGVRVSAKYLEKK